MYDQQTPETIEALFDSIAKKYDRANGVMSMQMHRIWNRRLVREVIEKSDPEVILDLCAGTGEIAFGFLAKAEKPCHAYLLDFSREMLECAKHKSSGLERHQIDFLKADAQEIPLLDNSVDCATIAYGIRNVQKPEKCIREVFRVLRPGGYFGILELTRPSNPVMKVGHQIYLRTILPVVGKLVSSNQEAYEYLCSSIHRFVAPSELMQIMKDTGFKSVESKSLSGGIATLISGVA